MSPTQPFVFLGCLELNELLPQEAHDARELLDQVAHVPVDSIFCHTSASLLHRPILAEAYPNDFSLWIGSEVRDVRLAERLAAIDAFTAGSMERVREDIIATISDHLQHLGTAAPRTQGKRYQCGGNASGSFKRSDFGMKFGLPTAIGDEVRLWISFYGFRQ